MFSVSHSSATARVRLHLTLGCRIHIASHTSICQSISFATIAMTERFCRRRQPGRPASRVSRTDPAAPNTLFAPEPRSRHMARSRAVHAKPGSVRGSPRRAVQCNVKSVKNGCGRWRTAMAFGAISPATRPGCLVVTTNTLVADKRARHAGAPESERMGRPAHAARMPAALPALTSANTRSRHTLRGAAGGAAGSPRGVAGTRGSRQREVGVKPAEAAEAANREAESVVEAAVHRGDGVRESLLRLGPLQLERRREQAVFD